MRIGWQEYIKRLLRGKSKFASVGIEVGEHQMHLSVLKNIAGELTWVIQDSLPINNWEATLATYVDQHRLANTPCYIAFSISKYQLLQMEKPSVPVEELSQALQWSVKEQLGSQEELLIDYFDSPGGGSGANKVNVVAITKAEIETLCKGVSRAGLEIKNISIEELVTSNLLVDSDEAVMTLFQEAGDQICLNIIKQNQLYFSRRLRGYENLSSFSIEELQLGVGDAISVEVQRSMDYFESQLRQAPVRKLFIAVDSPHQDALAEQIKQLTFLTVEPFTPALSKAKELDFSTSNLTSLGAAVSLETLQAEAS